jgi:hypothetical protein
MPLLDTSGHDVPLGIEVTLLDVLLSPSINPLEQGLQLRLLLLAKLTL